MGDLFCTFNHSAPWAGILFAGTMAVPIASVLLHGAWRLKLLVRPAAAVFALVVAAFMFAFGPVVLPNKVGLVILVGSVGVGLLLWWAILHTPSRTAVETV